MILCTDCRESKPIVKTTAEGDALCRGCVHERKIEEQQEAIPRETAQIEARESRQAA